MSRGHVCARLLAMFGHKSRANRLLSEACLLFCGAPWSPNRKDYAFILAEVRRALRCGANANTQDDHGWTPLSRALNNKVPEVVRILLHNGADVSPHGWSDLMSAIWRGDVDGLGRAVSNGAGINAFDNDGFVALHHAVLAREHKAISILLAHGANVNARREDIDSTPLILAAEIGDTHSVRLLLDKSADTELRRRFGDNALGAACDRGHVDVAEILLDVGAKVDPFDSAGQTPLMTASHLGHNAIVKLLIKRGASVSLQTGVNDGYKTALTLARRSGHMETVEILLAAGADPDSKDTMTRLRQKELDDLRERQDQRQKRIQSGWSKD